MLLSAFQVLFKEAGYDWSYYSSRYCRRYRNYNRSFLGISGEKLKVEVDEKEVAVREALPGNNCGGCGYPGCDGLAKAIAKGEAPANGCPVCSAEAKAKIAEIMGVESIAETRKVAYVKCVGNCDVAKMITYIPELRIVQWQHLFQTEDLRAVITDVLDLVHV